VPAPAAPAQPRSLVIVDGSNFLGTVGGYELASDASREELVTRLQDFVHQHPAFRVIVYFDGQKSSVRRAGGVEVRFTSRERPADFFILEGLRGLGEQERRRTLVVTADRALADSAHKLGAKAEATTSFQRRLPGVKRTAIGPRGLNATEVAEWEDYFNRPPEGADRRRKG
jgi:predicted RNA-binding protein with PIN domain